MWCVGGGGGHTRAAIIIAGGLFPVIVGEVGWELHSILSTYKRVLRCVFHGVLCIL